MRPPAGPGSVEHEEAKEQASGEQGAACEAFSPGGLDFGRGELAVVERGDGGLDCVEFGGVPAGELEVLVDGAVTAASQQESGGADMEHGKARVLPPDIEHADQCSEGEFDLILDSSQLGLQIHESIGHPIELDRVLAGALAKDPAQRYQTAADLRGDLKRLKRVDTGATPVATRQPAASRRWRTTAVSYWLALQPNVWSRTFTAGR